MGDAPESAWVRALSYANGGAKNGLHAALLTRGGFPNAAGWAYNGVSLFSEEMECIFLRKTSKRITA